VVVLLLPWAFIVLRIASALMCDGPFEAVQRVVSSSLSPDGRLRASVVHPYLDYGSGREATEVRVSLAARDDPDESTPVFRCYQDEAPLHDGNEVYLALKWLDSKSLSICYDRRCGVYLDERSANALGSLWLKMPVSILYSATEPEPEKKSPFAGNWAGKWTSGGENGEVSFKIGQFGELFGLLINGRTAGTPETITGLSDKGLGDNGSKLAVVGDHLTGVVRDGAGAGYRVDMKRSGPTVWVAPPRGG
jgi:hypothetical protein